MSPKNDPCQAQLRRLLDSFSDPCLVLQPVFNTSEHLITLTCHQVNLAAAVFKGLPKKELLGLDFTQVLPPQLGLEFLAAYQNVLQTATPLALDDLPSHDKYYDIRVTKYQDKLLYTYRDVTKYRTENLALTNTQKKYQLLANNATDIILLLSHNWQILWASPATKEVLGYDPQDLLDQNTADLIHPDDLSVLLKVRDQKKELINGVTYQLRVKKANGSFLWMSGISRIATDENGQEVGRISTLRDIHAQTLAEQKVQASQNHYRLLAENASDVVCRFDQDGYLTWVSPSVQTLLGWDPQFLLQKLSTDFIHPEDRSSLQTWKEQTLTQSFATPLEIRVLSSDKNYRWMSALAKPLKDTSGTLIGRVVGLRDIEEQTKVRSQLVAQSQELALSESHFRMLAENSSDVVVRVDTSGTIVWVSPSVEAVLNYSPEVLLNSRLSDLIYSEDAQQQNLWQQKLATDPYVPPLEVRIVTSTGNFRWMSLNTSLATSQTLTEDRVISLHDIHQQVLARQALFDSQIRYKLLAENSTDVVWQLDQDTKLLWITPSIETVLGYTQEQLLGTFAIDLLHYEDRQTLLNYRDQLFEGFTPPPFELRLCKPDGEFRWLSLQARPNKNPNGLVENIIIGLRDVHEQVLAQEALSQSERTFRLAMDGAPQGMAVVGLHGRFLRVNEALTTLLGKDATWLKEHTEYDIMDPISVEKDKKIRDILLSGHSDLNVHEGRIINSSGQLVWVQHSLALIRDEYKMPLFYVSQYQDITIARALKQDLTYRAEHDNLTGLITRPQLQDHIFKTLISYSSNQVPTLLFCDIDFFKHINDKYGHTAGDHVLKVTAQRLLSVLQPKDQAARLGGDEFVILLSNTQGLEDALDSAQELHHTISQPILFQKEQIAITLSIGVALATNDVNAHSLLRNADKALYQAKQDGRNRTVVYTQNLFKGDQDA